MLVRAKKSEPVWIIRELKDLPRPSLEGVTWFILNTNPNCVSKAAYGLIDKGLQVYCPLVRQMRKPPRSKPDAKPVEFARPAFSRYLFVGMPVKSSWWDVRRTDGVESVICNNLAPVVVSRDDIETIMMAEDIGWGLSNGVQLDTRPIITIRVGDIVTLTAGPFEGYEAVVKKAPKRLTETALIELAGLAMKVPLDMIRNVA